MSAAEVFRSATVPGCSEQLGCLELAGRAARLLGLVTRAWLDNSRSSRCLRGAWKQQGEDAKTSNLETDRGLTLCHNLQSRSFSRPSLVAQWLGVCLPMQGTRVRALVWEDPTCRGAAEPVCHNYWACTLEPASHSCWAHVPRLLKPKDLGPVLHRRSHRSERPAHSNGERPPLAAARESLRTATKTQCSQK